MAEALSMVYHVLPAFDTGSMDTAYDVAWGALSLLSTRNNVLLVRRLSSNMPHMP